MSTMTQDRQRGTLLTIWLVIMLIANGWTAFTYFQGLTNSTVNPVFQLIPGWAIVLLLILGVANVIATILLFSWKKIGLYIFSGSALIAFVVNIMIGISPLVALFGLIGVGIIWLLLRSRWHLFE
jgi:hypothetical protein